MLRNQANLEIAEGHGHFGEQMGGMMDDFVKDLQKQIYEETKAVYGEIFFQRWLNPFHMGSIRDADGYGRVKGPCGDIMEIFLKFEEVHAGDASYQTDGCGSSIACGSILSEMVTNMTVVEAQTITQSDLIEYCQGLPDEDKHCALLAVSTLQQAINDYEISLK